MPQSQRAREREREREREKEVSKINYLGGVGKGTLKITFPAGNYISGVTIETLEQVVKYVQS